MTVGYAALDNNDLYLLRLNEGDTPTMASSCPRNVLLVIADDLGKVLKIYLWLWMQYSPTGRQESRSERW